VALAASALADDPDAPVSSLAIVLEPETLATGSGAAGPRVGADGRVLPVDVVGDPAAVDALRALAALRAERESLAHIFAPRADAADGEPDDYDGPRWADEEDDDAAFEAAQRAYMAQSRGAPGAGAGATVALSLAQTAAGRTLARHREHQAAWTTADKGFGASRTAGLAGTAAGKAGARARATAGIKRATGTVSSATAAAPSMLVSSTRARAAAEVAGLRERAASLRAADGPTTWETTLRGHQEALIPVGGPTAGLYCKALVRRPARVEVVRSAGADDAGAGADFFAGADDFDADLDADLLLGAEPGALPRDAAGGDAAARSAAAAWAGVNHRPRAAWMAVRGASLADYAAGYNDLTTAVPHLAARAAASARASAAAEEAAVEEARAATVAAAAAAASPTNAGSTARVNGPSAVSTAPVIVLGSDAGPAAGPGDAIAAADGLLPAGTARRETAQLRLLNTGTMALRYTWVLAVDGDNAPGAAPGVPGVGYGIGADAFGVAELAGACFPLPPSRDAPVVHALNPTEASAVEALCMAEGYETEALAAYDVFAAPRAQLALALPCPTGTLLPGRRADTRLLLARGPLPIPAASVADPRVAAGDGWAADARRVWASAADGSALRRLAGPLLPPAASLVHAAATLETVPPLPRHAPACASAPADASSAPADSAAEGGKTQSVSRLRPRQVVATGVAVIAPAPDSWAAVRAALASALQARAPALAAASTVQQLVATMPPSGVADTDIRTEFYIRNNAATDAAAAAAAAASRYRWQPAPWSGLPFPPHTVPPRAADQDEDEDNEDATEDGGLFLLSRGRVYFHASQLPEWRALAADVIAAHPRSMRGSLGWDLTAAWLRGAIALLPPRAHAEAPLLRARWEALVERAQQPPEPHAASRAALGALLLAAAAHTPRLTHAAALAVPMPLEPAAAAAARAAAAGPRKWGAAPVDPAPLLAYEAQCESVRARRRELLTRLLSQRVAAAIAEWAAVAAPAAGLAAENPVGKAPLEALAAAQAAAVNAELAGAGRLCYFGDGTPTPDPGPRAESAAQRRARLEAERRRPRAAFLSPAQKAEQARARAILAADSLHGAAVTAVALGPAGALVATTGRTVTAWRSVAFEAALVAGATADKRGPRGARAGPAVVAAASAASLPALFDSDAHHPHAPDTPTSAAGAVAVDGATSSSGATAAAAEVHGHPGLRDRRAVPELSGLHVKQLLVTGTGTGYVVTQSGSLYAWGPTLAASASPASIALPPPPPAADGSLAPPAWPAQSSTASCISDGDLVASADSFTDTTLPSVGASVAKAPPARVSTAAGNRSRLSAPVPMPAVVQPPSALSMSLVPSSVVSVTEPLLRPVDAALARMRVASIAVSLDPAPGQFAAFALTDSGALYAWGDAVSAKWSLLPFPHRSASAAASAPPVTTPALVPGFAARGLRVASVACGAQHAVALTTGGAVYSWGANDAGQLGLGDKKPRLLPALVETISPAGATNDLQLDKVDEDGNVQIADSVADGAAAVGGRGRRVSHGPGAAPGALLSPASTSTTPSGGNSLVPPGSAGTPAGSSASTLARLRGRGGSAANAAAAAAAEEAALRPFDPVVALDCGLNFTLAVTAAGVVYAWGEGRDGALGLGDSKDRDRPVRVDGFVVAEPPAAASATAVAADAGSPSRSARRPPSQHKRSSAPPPVVGAFKIAHPQGLDKVMSSVRAGHRHVIALAQSGDIWVWGRNGAGQLGLGPTVADEATIVSQPTLVPALTADAVAPARIIAVHAGGNASAVTLQQPEEEDDDAADDAQEL
jgi:hypothetical protein